MEIIVIGHKNPDTDSVVSALLFADFLNKTEKPLLGFTGYQAIPGRAGELNKETEFVFDYFEKTPPPLIESVKGKKVVLVDHGEYEQSPRGIEQSNLVGVLDHHKMGGIKTAEPIFYRAEPIGSTSTIIARMFLESNISLDEKSSGLLLAGILSDTLKLTSPTTTREDRKTASKLTEIAGENIEELTSKMFEAKSDISGISPEELISKDYKEYEAGDKKMGIGVWETTAPQKVIEKKEKLMAALKKLKEKKEIPFMFFVVVDILEGNSTMFLVGEDEKEAASKAFKKELDNNLLFLEGVVSRKKQIVPPLTKSLKEK